MSVKERLKIFIASEGLSVSDFEKSIDAGNGYVNNISKSIGVDKLEKISKKYPYLNIEWLLVDVGEMRKEKGEPQFRPDVDSEELAVINAKVRRIPIYDISAAAGVSGFINGGNAEILDYISLPAHMIRRGSNYVGVLARGDSMSPTIYDSSIIVAREMDKGEWLEMPDEHVYIIVSGEDAYLKRVKNRFERNFIVCMSDNLDKFNYPSFNFQSEEVNHIFHAELLVSARMPNINETYYSRLKQVEDRVDEISDFIKKIR